MIPILIGANVSRVVPEIIWLADGLMWFLHMYMYEYVLNFYIYTATYLHAQQGFII